MTQDNIQTYRRTAYTFQDPWKNSVLKGFSEAVQNEYIQALMELAGKVPRLANTTPAVFFAPRSQLSEVFPACWACEGKREDQTRGKGGEREHMIWEREWARERKGRNGSVKQRDAWWGKTHLVCRLLQPEPLGLSFSSLLPLCCFSPSLRTVIKSYDSVKCKSDPLSRVPTICVCECVLKASSSA